MKITRIGSALALLVGLGFAISGYLSYRWGQAEYRDWIEADAELLGARSTFDAVRDRLYYPKVRFTPEGGKEIEAEVIYPTERSQDRGEAKVFYDRKDPRRVALDYSVRQRRDSGRNGVIGGGFFAVVGLLGLVFGGRRRA